VVRAKARVVQGPRRPLYNEGPRERAGPHQRHGRVARPSHVTRKHGLRAPTAAASVNAENDVVAHLGKIVSGHIGRLRWMISTYPGDGGGRPVEPGGGGGGGGLSMHVSDGSVGAVH